jgi:hypothetical protein
MRALVVLVLFLNGCASHTVRCNGRLEPINQGGVASSPTTSGKAS